MTTTAACVDASFILRLMTVDLSNSPYRELWDQWVDANRAIAATYDFHYLALANRLNAEFWSSDKRLIQVVQSTFSWVHLVESP